MDAVADEAVVVRGNGKGDNTLGKEEWTDPGTFSWTGSTNSDVVRSTTTVLPSLLRSQLFDKTSSIVVGLMKKDVIVD